VSDPLIDPRLLEKIKTESIEEAVTNLRIDMAVVKTNVINGVFVRHEDCARQQMRLWRRFALLLAVPIFAGIVGLLFMYLSK